MRQKQTESGAWELGRSILDWKRIAEFAKRVSPEEAAIEFDVPEEAARDSMRVDLDDRRMKGWELLG